MAGPVLRHAVAGASPTGEPGAKIAAAFFVYRLGVGSTLHHAAAGADNKRPASFTGGTLAREGRDHLSPASRLRVTQTKKRTNGIEAMETPTARTRPATRVNSIISMNEL